MSARETRRLRPVRTFQVLILAACLEALSTPGIAQEVAGPTGTEMPLTTEARSEALAAIEPRYLEWLQSVRGLMTQPELDYFLRLQEDFRRDAFMRAFWDPRDPDPANAAKRARGAMGEVPERAGWRALR